MLRFPCVFQPKGKVLPYSRCLSEAVLSHSRRSRASLGAHYLARYSLGSCLGSTCGARYSHRVSLHASVFTQGNGLPCNPAKHYSVVNVLYGTILLQG